MNESNNTSSSNFYIPDPIHGWLPASLLNNSTYKVSVPSNVETLNPKDGSLTVTETVIEEEREVKNLDLSSLPMQNLDENGNLLQASDMCDLPYLHEAAILFSLLDRHQSEKPYTSIGRIMIAVNPFQWIPSLYSEEVQKAYTMAVMKDDDVDMPPHVYQTSTRAYLGLQQMNQAILVSGESGAGKTETVKLLMHHLAKMDEICRPKDLHEELMQTYSGDADEVTNGSNETVSLILASNPILEAFGNAKTVRNDNSSRFGKFLQLMFTEADSDVFDSDGNRKSQFSLSGSQTQTYLLEKSRIVNVSPGERNYHIFYQLLSAGLNTCQGLYSGFKDHWNIEYFDYLVGAAQMIDGHSDADRFAKTTSALRQMLGTNAREKLSQIMQGLLVVLLLGNISFDENEDNQASISSSNEKSQEAVKAVAHLLNIEEDHVIKSITTKELDVGREKVTKRLTAEQAKDTVDSISKTSYSRIFDYLVEIINNSTTVVVEDGKHDVRCIGLLDIFGFESFQVNSFEQLCINYTNEKLQRKYTLDVFTTVKEEYKAEELPLLPNHFSYEDNVHILNLFEGKFGLLNLLNEECLLPKGNESALVRKAKSLHVGTKDSSNDVEVITIVPKKLEKPSEFTVRHYAGDVTYTADNFLAKNKDKHDSALPLLSACSNDILKISEDEIENSKEKGGKGSKANFISSKFRSQLHNLMQIVGETSTHYIRCIKPNIGKKAKIMNLASATEQLKCAGVVAAVTVSRVAFPNRLLHDVCRKRFHFCVEKKHEKIPDMLDDLLTPYVEECHTTTKENDDDKPIYLIGKTRVYFAAGTLEFMEKIRRIKLDQYATKIQAIVRGFLASTNYDIAYDSVLTMQTFWRCFSEFQKYNKALASIIKLQCFTRCAFARAELTCLKRAHASTIITCAFRCFSRNKKYRVLKKTAVIAQKIARRYLVRKEFGAMLEEHREEQKMENQLKKLQQKLALLEAAKEEEERKRVAAEKKLAESRTKIVTAGNDGGEEEFEMVQGSPTKSEKSLGEEKEEDQGSLMHESAEMLEYLRKEVFVLKSRNYLYRTDLHQYKESLHRLQEKYEQNQASNAALKQHANQLSATNMKLIVENNNQKSEISDLNKELRIATHARKSDKEKLKNEMKKMKADHAKEIQKLERALAKTKSDNKKPSANKTKPVVFSQINKSILPPKSPSPAAVSPFFGLPPATDTFKLPADDDDVSVLSMGSIRAAEDLDENNAGFTAVKSKKSQRNLKRSSKRNVSPQDVVTPRSNHSGTRPPRPLSRTASSSPRIVGSASQRPPLLPKAKALPDGKWDHSGYKEHDHEDDDAASVISYASRTSSFSLADLMVDKQPKNKKRTRGKRGGRKRNSAAKFSTPTTSGGRKSPIITTVTPVAKSDSSSSLAAAIRATSKKSSP